jgi:hypothetical protein
MSDSADEQWQHNQHPDYGLHDAERAEAAASQTKEDSDPGGEYAEAEKIDQATSSGNKGRATRCASSRT